MFRTGARAGFGCKRQAATSSCKGISCELRATSCARVIYCERYPGCKLQGNSAASFELRATSCARVITSLTIAVVGLPTNNRCSNIAAVKLFNFSTLQPAFPPDPGPRTLRLSDLRGLSDFLVFLASDRQPIFQFSIFNLKSEI
jgi:hypothetical protein